MSFGAELDQFLRKSCPSLDNFPRVDRTRFRIHIPGRLTRHDMASEYLRLEPRIAEMLPWVLCQPDTPITGWYMDTALLFAACISKVIPKKAVCSPGCEHFHAAATNYFLSKAIAEPEDFEMVVQMVSAVGFVDDRYNPYANPGANNLYQTIRLHHSWLQGSGPNGPCPSSGRRSFRDLALQTVRSVSSWKRMSSRADVYSELMVSSAMIQTVGRIKAEMREDLLRLSSDREAMEKLAVAAVETFKANNPALSETMNFHEDPLIALARLAGYVATAKWIQARPSTESQAEELPSEAEDITVHSPETETTIRPASFAGSVTSFYTQLSEAVDRTVPAISCAASGRNQELCAAIVGELKARRRAVYGSESESSG